MSETLEANMRRPRPEKRVLTDNFSCVGPDIRDLVHARTEELAVLAGRAPQDVTLEDYAQAKREITGQSDRILQDAILGAPSTDFTAIPRRPLFRLTA
jgi:hypothetical protein